MCARDGQIAVGDLQNWRGILRTFVRIGLLAETTFLKAALSRLAIIRISIVITFRPFHTVGGHGDRDVVDDKFVPDIVMTSPKKKKKKRDSPPRSFPFSITASAWGN